MLIAGRYVQCSRRGSSVELLVVRLCSFYSSMRSQYLASYILNRVNDNYLGSHVRCIVLSS